MKSTHTRVFDVWARAGGAAVSLCLIDFPICTYIWLIVGEVVVFVVGAGWLMIWTAHTHTQTRSATVPKRNGLFRTMFGKLDEFLINFYAELLALPGPHHHAPINYSSAPYVSTLLQRMLCHRPTDITLLHWCVCVCFVSSFQNWKLR